MTIPGILFRRPDGAIVHIELPPMAEAIELAGRTFERKSEFHVTLLGREILTRAGALEIPALENAIRHAARKIRFAVDFRDDFRLLKEGEAATIIRMCEVSGADDFYGGFASETGIRIARPPFHVTLFTSGTRKGIGVATTGELEIIGRRLAPPETGLLLRAIT